MSRVASALARVCSPLTRMARGAGSGQRHGPIGLELGHGCLHMVQLQPEGEALRVRAAASLPYPVPREELIADPQALAAFIRRLLARHPFVGREVVTCMPPEYLKLTLLNYKLQADLSESEAIMRQAMDRVEGSPEQWMLDYVPVSTRSEIDGERGALLALVRRSDVFSYLEAFEKARLDVTALEIGPVAIHRLVAYMHSGDAFETALIINFGRDKSFLTVISGRRLLLDREVEFGEEKIIASVADTLEMSRASVRELVYHYGLSTRKISGADDQETVTPGEIARTVTEIAKPMLLELAEEVTKVLMYTASQTRGGSVNLVYLLGSIARWPGAEALINGMLSLPVQVLDPLRAFDDGERQSALPKRERTTGLAIATGCALRGQVEHV